VLAGLAAVLLGLSYGLCLVCGLHDAEQMAGPGDRGTVLAAYYVVAYLGFAAPYGVDGLNPGLGKPGTFAVLAGIAALVGGLTWQRAAWVRPGTSVRGYRTEAASSPAVRLISGPGEAAGGITAEKTSELPG
jgi:hypothetical protein